MCLAGRDRMERWVCEAADSNPPIDGLSSTTELYLWTMLLLWMADSTSTV